MKHYEGHQTKEDEVGGIFNANEKLRNAYNILVGKPDWKKPLGRRRTRWKDKLKRILNTMWA
jgi:hypothetical protein